MPWGNFFVFPYSCLSKGGGRGCKLALEVEVGTAGGLKVGGGGRLYFLLAGVDAGALVVTGLGLAGGAAGLGATGVTALSRPEAATPEVDVGTAVGTVADAVATVADAAGTTG